MPNINNTLSAHYQYAIGTFHHSRAYHTEKENQRLLNQLAKSPVPSNRHAAALNIIHAITLLTLVSNGLHSDDIKHSPRKDTPSNLPAVTPCTYPIQMASHLAYNLFFAFNDAIKQYDFLPDFPVASAHVIPNTTPSLSPDIPRQPDVTAERIDFSCAEQRKTLSLAKILRQVGKTLESPISTMGEESQVAYHFNTFRQGCIPPSDLKKLTAITQRADSVLNTILTFIPYANPLVIAKNIGGPLLQLIADDIEGRPMDKERTEDTAEQIIFLAKSVIEFSPKDANGNQSAEGLVLPENISVKNNQVLTKIDNKAWRLIVKDHTFWAIRHNEKQEVTYSSTDKQWRFTKPHKARANIPHASKVTSTKVDARRASHTAISVVQQKSIRPPHNAAKIDEKRLKSDAPQPHTSNTAPLREKPTPQRLTRSERKKLRTLLTKLMAMDTEERQNAGGLSDIATANDVPLATLQRYIKPDTSLTKRGERLLQPATHMLSPKAQGEKAGPAKRHEEIATDTHITVDEQRAIVPHKGIAQLISAVRDDLHRTSLFGNIEGVTSPLVYNLEQDVFYLAMQNTAGEWERVADLPYIAEEGKSMLSLLPASEKHRTVTHKQRMTALKAIGSDLDLITVSRLLAEKPVRQPIPQKISSIWVGKNPIPENLMKNLANNAMLSATGNTPFAFTLYLSRRSESAYLRNIASLHRHAPGIMVIALENTVFYQHFRQSKYYEQYHAAIEGNGGTATNFASAADVLRFQLLKHFGGIYMDVDDTLLQPLSSAQLQATASGFVLHTPMHNDMLGMVYQFPTSIIGSHAKNPILDIVSDTIYTRYQENKDIYKNKPPVTDTENFNQYAKRLSYVSGPGLFDSVIRQHCVEERQVLEAHKLYQYPLDSMRRGSLYDIFTFLFFSDITSISGSVDVGSANSWEYSRR